MSVKTGTYKNKWYDMDTGRTQHECGACRGKVSATATECRHCGAIFWNAPKKMRGIYMKDWEIREALDDNKTIFRVVIDPQPRAVYHDGAIYEDGAQFILCQNQNGGLEQIALPYKPGDILFVKESWAESPNAAHSFIYKASTPHPDTMKGRWHPSSHMTSSAARLFLQVTDVKVERLQDITEDDCRSEGIRAWSKDGRLYKYYPADYEGDYPDCAWDECPRTLEQAMKQLWNQRIKPAQRNQYGWYANPWVFVMKFVRLPKDEVMKNNI